jgi:hypothetical protein
MKGGHFSRRLSIRTFRLVRLLVRLFSVCVIILFSIFVFLRIYGVPKPLLATLVQRANAAGIPVDIDSVKLTLRGWKAVGVRYYSRHPDDLEPMFSANEVLFARHVDSESDGPAGWGFDVDAVGIIMTPSGEWGVDMPEYSPARNLDRLQLSLSFLPDRIQISEGQMRWMGIDFIVEGTFFKKRTPASRRRKPDAPRTPVEREPPGARRIWLTKEMAQKVEDQIRSLDVSEGCSMNISFLIDPSDVSRNHVDFSGRLNSFAYDGIGFSGLDFEGAFDFPELKVKRISTQHKDGRLDVSARYDFKSSLVSGSLNNSITSADLLHLLPVSISNVLPAIGVEVESIPRCELAAGPVAASNILNDIRGSFTIADLHLRDLHITTLKGNVQRKDGRLELTELSGSVADQMQHSQSVGSSMAGGKAEGMVFWDVPSHEFGVRAEGSFDPNLLLTPLSDVRIATNVISRFRFKNRPPEVTLELGARVNDWSTFYLDIRGAGDNVIFHDVEFTSVNAAVSYTNHVLDIERVAGLQGALYVKGAAQLDFSKSTVRVDGVSTLPLSAVEDVAYAGFDLFGSKVKTDGATRLRAHGILDWGSMRATDFTAEVEVDQVEVPIARLNRFKSRVSGSGPLVSILDASFDIYGGSGIGDMEIELDPASTNIPYRLGLNLAGSDFRQCLLFLNPALKSSVSGKVTAEADVQSDFTTDFFTTADGTGSVSIVEGQLADLPFFNGFSRLMRMVIPSFNVFSITSLRGSFALNDGVIRSEDAFFGGDIISAVGHGSYSKVRGFDARVHAQVASDKGLSKVVRTLTNPLFRLFEMELGGTLANPEWRLEKLPGGLRSGSEAKEKPKSD